MITEQQLTACYDAYIKASGLDLKFTTHIRYYLERFCFEGYTPEDITLVVGYLKRRIKVGKRQKESLLPRNLLQNTSNFAEDLSMAKSEQRVFKDRINPSKQVVLNATGRLIETKDTCMPVAQIIAERLKMSALLKEWRTNL